MGIAYSRLALLVLDICFSVEDEEALFSPFSILCLDTNFDIGTSRGIRLYQYGVDLK